MALSIQEQIMEQFKGCESALIVLPESPSTDAVAAAVTLQDYLAKQGKDVIIASWNYRVPEKISFLKLADKILPKLTQQSKLIVEIDMNENPISDVSYQVKNQTLQILLTPQDKLLNTQSVKLIEKEPQYDIIIALNVIELETLGGLYNDQNLLFENTPIINIDHRPDNEQYGQINWVNINATSTSQMVYELLYSKQAPPKEIATTLLAGIMDETHALRSKQVNSQSLNLVGKLLEAGGDHETVVNNLYRTKTVGLLKLWGHVLNNLQADREHSLAWSVIPESVFASTGTDKEHLHDLMHEVLSHSPEAKTVLLFLETNGPEPEVEIQISTLPPLHAKDLIKNWQPRGSERMAFATIKQTNLADAERNVISVVKQRLDNVLGPR